MRKQQDGPSLPLRPSVRLRPPPSRKAPVTRRCHPAGFPQPCRTPPLTAPPPKWPRRPARAGRKHSLIDSVLKLTLVPLAPPARVLAMTCRV